MSSEVEGLPSAGTDHPAGPVPPTRPRRPPIRLRRLLRRPFRSILSEVRSSVLSEVRRSQSRFEGKMDRAVGDLSGLLLGDLADLQLAVQRLESRVERMEEMIGSPPPAAAAARTDRFDRSTPSPSRSFA